MIGCQIISDNETQFVNETVAQFLDTIGVEHFSIHPYLHKENSIIERANKEVNRQLGELCFIERLNPNDTNFYH